MYQQKILKSMLEHGDVDTFSIIDNKEEHIFTESSNLALYHVLADYYVKFDKMPQESYLEEMFKLEKESEAKESYKELKTYEGTEQDIVPIVILQLKHTIKHTFQRKLKASANATKTANLSNIEDLILELQETLEDLQRLLDTAEVNESLLHGDSAADSFRKRYRKNKDNNSYFVSEYGLKPLDNHLGGIIRGDLISVLGYTNQGKSPLLRFIAYKQLLQGKNVIFVPLESDHDKSIDQFLVLHANNIERFGAGNPVITMDNLKHSNLTQEAEDYLLDTVVEDFTNSDDMGTLYIFQPEDEIAFEELKSKVRMVHKNIMPVDFLVIDYATLLLPSASSSRYDKDSVNFMLRRLRLFGLTFDKGRNPLQIVNAVQSQRKGYEDMLKNKGNYYSLTAISDYNAIERDSTNIFSVAQTPEMAEANEVQLQGLKARDNKLMSPTKIQFNGGTGWYLDTVSVTSEEEAIELIDEIDLSDI
ncbi:replicative DNA helicase [Thiovulum sp. ES]|nr:replicative DNA helicase [Thiovulum sp. ES]